MVQINNSTQPVSYKEIDITIPPNGFYTIQQPYNYVRLLECSTQYQNLAFRFGALSIETSLTLGIGLGFPEIFPSLTITNKTNGTVTLRLAFSVGVITDDRLNITGSVDVNQAPYSNVQSSLETFDANGEIAIDSTAYKRVVIQNNSSTDSIYIFANNTFEVQPNGTFDLNFAGTFTIYGTTGQTASVGYFS